MIKLIIDNIPVEVEEGTSILNAARKIGGKIVPPAMCYYSRLKGSGGKCRTCLVKIARLSDKDPRPNSKLVASCSTPVQEGMVVQNITSPEVIETRKAIVEFLLLNHPLDCPVCDQAGECDLQNLSFEHGFAETRTDEPRREYPPVDIGPYIKLHMNRCILCYRCVLLADQLTDNRVHGVFYRGDQAEITTYIENIIVNEFSGNIIDVCPVGALTDLSFRFKSRVWFLKPMNAHRDCKKCSGNVIAWMYGNEILRVTTRKDQYGECEDYICNECRFEKKNQNDWIIEGPRKISPKSVISTGHYETGSMTRVINPIAGKMDNPGSDQ